MAESICQHITLTYTTSMLTNNDYTLYHYALKAIVQAIIDTKTGWVPDPEFLDMSTGEYIPAYEANPSVEADKYSCINLSHNSGHKMQLCCGSQIPCSEEYHYDLYNSVPLISPQTILQGFTITYINNKTDKELNSSSIEEGATIATITKNQDFYSLELGRPLYSFSDIYVNCSVDGNQVSIIFVNNLVKDEEYNPLYYRGLIAGEICKPIIYPSGDFHPLTNIVYTAIQSTNFYGYNINEAGAAISLLLDKKEVFISGRRQYTFYSTLAPVVSGAAWSFDKAISSVVTTRGVEQTIISPGIFYVGGGDVADFKVVEGSGIKGYLDTQYLGFCYNYTLPTEQEPVLADGYMLQDGEYIYINKMALNWSKQNSQDKNPFYYRNLLHTEILDLSNFRTVSKHYYQIDGVTKAFYPKINSDIYLTVYDPTAGKTYSLGKAVWERDNVNNTTYCKWNNFAGAFPITVSYETGLRLNLVDGEQSAFAELDAGGTSSWATSGIKFYVSYEEMTNPYSWHMDSYGFLYNFGHEYSAEMNWPPFLNFGCLLSEPASAITFFLDDFEQTIDKTKPVMLSIGNVGTVVIPQQSLFRMGTTFMNTTWMGSSFLITDSATHASKYAWINDSNKIAISRFDREDSSPYYIFVGVDSPLAQSDNTNDLIVYFNVNTVWY